MRSASCMYPLMSVLPTVNYRTSKRVSWTGTPCSFCDRSMNVLSVSYTVHIPFVRYTSVIRKLAGHSLPVICLVRMHSLRLPRRHSPPLRRLPSLDKHFLRYLYPLICDSTITHVFPLICDSTIRLKTHFIFGKRFSLVLNYLLKRANRESEIGLEVIKLEYSLKLKIKCNEWLLLDTCLQAIIALYFEYENELKFYNLDAWLLL